MWPQRKWPHLMVHWLWYALLISWCSVALGSLSSVGRRFIARHFPLYHWLRQLMIIVAIGAGEWYHNRCLRKSWRALVLAAVLWLLLHRSTWVTFSLRSPQAKHLQLILLLICARWCNVGVHLWAYFEIWIFWPEERAVKEDWLHWWGGKHCLHQNHVVHQFFV